MECPQSHPQRMLLHSNRERRMSFLDPTIGAFNMSLPARQRHLCLAGATVHRSRTTSVALLVHYSHTRRLYIRLGLVALVFSCQHQLAHARPTKQLQNSQDHRIRTDCDSLARGPRTAAEPLICHQYPNLEQPQLPAVSRIDEHFAVTLPPRLLTDILSFL